MSSTGFNQDRIWEHFQNEGVDSFSLSTGRQEFLVRRLRANGRVLNVGVGNAVLEILAQRKGLDVWCLDPGERAIDRVRSQLHLGAQAQVGYCQAMPFPDEHFDTVVMSEVLEHLDEATLASTWQEVRRVLRPGGGLPRHCACPRKPGGVDGGVSSLQRKIPSLGPSEKLHS